MKKEKTASTKKKVSARVQRNRRIAALIAILIGVGVWYALVGPGSKVVVPSLAGLTVKEAKATLEDLGLNLNVTTQEFSEDIPEGKIITSDPAGGGRVSPNGDVDVTISQGKERYAVPTLQGLKQDVAEQQLKENKLILGEIKEEYSTEFPKGFIMRSEPAAGERVKPESQVTIYISLGIEQVTLSDYKGKSGEQALNELSDEGFDVNTKYVYSEDLPPGAVISQTPGAGEADKGSTITLLVSKGSEFVNIPNIKLMKAGEARKVLENLGLKLKEPNVRNWTTKLVKTISPVVGTKVKRGSTITITVG